MSFALSDLIVAYRKAKVEAFDESNVRYGLEFADYETNLLDNLGTAFAMSMTTKDFDALVDLVGVLIIQITNLRSTCDSLLPKLIERSTYTPSHTLSTLSPPDRALLSTRGLLMTYLVLREVYDTMAREVRVG